MTEAEWLACQDPTPMVEFLEGKVADRKLRLFAVACCQTYHTYFTDERSCAAIEVASQVADGTVEESERERAFVAAYSVATWTYDSDTAAEVAAYTCGDRVQLNDVPWRVMRAFAFDIYQNPRHLTRRLLYDLFGPLPFRPVSADPSWLTSTVVALAEGIYQELAFDRMPILADALQDAGCNNEDILNHCRQPGEHVRGCWVVDLLLGKA
jgi:hypothetical protein